MMDRNQVRRVRYWAITRALAAPGVTFTAQFGAGRSLSYRYEDGLMHTKGLRSQIPPYTPMTVKETL